MIEVTERGEQVCSKAILIQGGLMTYKNIIYREEGRIGFLTLNRPETRNALSLEMLDEIHRCLRDGGNEKRVKVIIIKGSGPSFCAGHDMKEILNKGIDNIRELFGRCILLMSLMHDIPQPVICQVHGIATAAGCQLVAASDLAIAEEGARFATPGVKIGLFCTTPSVPLSRAVGRKRAMEMLLTGRFIDADEALEFGLVNRVVPLNNLDKEAAALAEEISGYSLETLGLGKRGFYRQIEMQEHNAYMYASELISANALMDDAVEGMSAFFEKRDPVWSEK